MLREILALALCGAAAAASAQLTPDNPDWKEIEVPPPPALRLQGLVPIEVERATLAFAIDPASVTVGKDSIVRYVVVASSSTGTVNAMYEGIRCASGEGKTYARHNADSGWVPVRESEWRDLGRMQRHSLVIARSGVCFGHAPNGSATQIVHDLRASVDSRFQRGGVSRP